MNEFKHFAGSTSLKGIPRIYKSEESHIRRVWVIGVIAMLCITVYQTVQLVDQYLDYPVDIIIDDKGLIGDEHRKRPDQVPYFLSLTICNLQPFEAIDKEAIAAAPSYAGYLSFINTVDEQFKNNLTRGRGSFGEAALDIMVTDFLKSSRGYYSYLGHSVSKTIGLSAGEFIVGCQIAVLSGQEKTLLPCRDMVSIRSVFIPKYFNCFTVEPEEELLKSRGVYITGYQFILHPGESSSLDIALANVGIGERSMDAGQGVKFAFHKPGTMPPFDVLDHGHSIASGNGVAVTTHMRLRELDRLPRPYNPCHTDRALHTDTVDLDGRAIRHSGFSNTASCIQSKVAEKCACLHPEISVKPTEHVNKSVCGFGFNDRSGQLDLEGYKYAREGVACAIITYADALSPCFTENFLECHEISVDLTFSSDRFPTTEQKPAFVKNYLKGNSYMEKRYQRLINTYDYFLNASTDSDKLRYLNDYANSNQIENSFLKVEFRMIEFTIHQVKQRAKYTITNVLSSFGGISNIYSGITAIVLVEIIDMMIRICARKLRGSDAGKHDCQEEREERKSTQTSL